ncbi:hypothetical protein QUB08_29255 [Microcoleus sp. BR0-C5]|uniref:hypothetical protein n=1 Tax=Microcoleus sp. BR0-C5 TaxID=2818713 RepID=UPI002FD54AD6
MMTDADLTPFECSDFFDGNTEADAFNSGGIEPDYIKRHIERIPHYGDDSRYRLASHLDMFDDLNPNGSLTDEQRQAVDDFVANYQPDSDDKDGGPEMDFPECQYVMLGVDLGTATELGDSWRRGESLPVIGRAEADRLSNRLNQTTNQRVAVEK